MVFWLVDVRLFLLLFVTGEYVNYLTFFLKININIAFSVAKMKTFKLENKDKKNILGFC